MFKLPSLLGPVAADDLKRGLTARAPGTPVDAGDVTQVSALCLQVLAAARRTDPGLTFAAVSPDFFAAVNSLALNDALGLAADGPGHD